MSNHDAAIEALKQQIPSAKRFFADWPMATPPLPGAVHADVDMRQTSGFKDPRLVLYTGISHVASVRVGWCLFGAARNIQPGHAVLPPSAEDTLSDPNTVRVLQLLAVGQEETEEAAIEALAVPGTVNSLVRFAAAVHQGHEGRSAPIRYDVGTDIYAYHRPSATERAFSADVVLIGSPIWIGKPEAKTEGS
ncbi:hypothetical protein ACWCQP_37250 [Streptomyces chartreusis]